jgi:DNA ligase 1
MRSRMSNTLEDGAETRVKGSSSTYTLTRKGHVYSCTCPAWRNQGATLDRRTCKHLKAYLGAAFEDARVSASAPLGVAVPVPAKPRAEGGEGEAEDKAPPILLAHKWEVEHDPTGWWMSEKLDGVRAYWDGEAFVSRLGNKFYAPEWFTEDLPADTLDGELWVGRKLFSKTISIVRSGAAGEAWKEVTYVVFDAPNARGGFEERIAHVDKVLKKASSRYARVHEHEVCDGFDHLRDELTRVEGLGGEGLMLRQPKSTYEVGRSTSLLKVKTFHDAEGRVIAHVPGAGRHKGRLGAVTCELPSGVTFNIGTGFSDAERQDPPPIGAVVTFRFQELTDDGIPRFPSWVGVRIDAEWPPRSEARPVSHAASGNGKPAAAKKVAVKEVAVKEVAVKEIAVNEVAPAQQAPAPEDSSAELSISLVHPEGKFWHIEVNGTGHVTRFGKVGTPGQNRLSELGSAAAARSDAEKRAAQKRKEGYAAKK